MQPVPWWFWGLTAFLVVGSWWLWRSTYHPRYQGPPRVVCAVLVVFYNSGTIILLGRVFGWW
jgi:hypothetical protein